MVQGGYGAVFAQLRAAGFGIALQGRKYIDNLKG
jgi:hypothetical protein